MITDPTRQLRIRREFDQMINMSVEEMQAHFSSTDSDLASLNPKLTPSSGKALGKRALVLKQKAEWAEADYNEAAAIVRPLRWQLGRKVPLSNAEGSPTLFTIALRNRGHDPLKTVATVTEAELSLGRKNQKVRAAIQDAMRLILPPVVHPDGNVDEPYVWVSDERIFETYAVVEWEREAIFLQVNYAWEGDEVVVDPMSIIEVEQAFVPVTSTIEQGDIDAVVVGELTEVAEAVAGEAPKWIGKMISAGKAKNKAPNGLPREYTAEVLKAAVEEGVFDGVPGYLRNDEQHGKESGWTKVGEWGKAAWDEVKQAVVNTFTWIPDKYPALFDKKLRVAIAEGKVQDLPGCSITGDVWIDKKAPHLPAKITEVRSCDWISYASAGGVLLAIQESDKERNTMRITALKALQSKGLTVPAKLAPDYEKIQIAEGAAAEFMLAQLKEKKGKLFEKMPDLEGKLGKDEEMLVALFEDFMAAEGVEPVAPPEPDGGSSAVVENHQGRASVREAEDEALRNEMRRLAIEGLIANSGLNEIEQRTIRRQFDSSPFDKAKVQEAIQEAKDRMAAYGQQAPRTRIDVQRDSVDKLQQAANDFFFSDVTEHGVRQAVREAHGEEVISKDHRGSQRSLRELYIALTGDNLLSFDISKVAEAIDPATVTKILQNAMNLRLLREWSMPSAYDAWRLLADVVPVPNFQKQEIMRTGYFGALALIGKDDPYPELSQGAKLDNNYTPETYGGMLSIHRKDIINDNVGEIRRHPARLSVGAKLDLSAFVWSLILSNPTLGDGVALFHSSHGNLLEGDTAAAGLSATTLGTMDGKLRDQTLPGRSDKMMLPTKYVIIPANAAMRKLAYEVLAPAYGQNNSVPTFAQSLSVQGIECPHTTDADDWYVATAKEIQEILEVGFFQGREEPEILLADNELAGALFTHDKVQYKVRHEYGGSVVDYRGIAKSAVT